MRNYLSMLGFKLYHVSKGGPGRLFRIIWRIIIGINLGEDKIKKLHYDTMNITFIDPIQIHDDFDTFSCVEALHCVFCKFGVEQDHKD